MTRSRVILNDSSSSLAKVASDDSYLFGHSMTKLYVLENILQEVPNTSFPASEKTLLQDMVPHPVKASRSKLNVFGCMAILRRSDEVVEIFPIKKK
ncbi:hypothetical protein NPIL_271321 [Nephila pilipes]|uniref:Uncharacterized protein n=1 Tax=Nephila pilipes TaxID=299642 RepID=A0A8X6K0T1_NEPPI|nr:hypothetical protein NPIL_271321 [Nephila pilipes]